jgi:hypothetical protein
MIERKRDTSFLVMAAIAATGGVLAIGFSIGFPIWAVLHGRPYTPAFSLFAAWGVAALAGAFACLRTYQVTDGRPRNPPPGGLRLALVKNTDAVTPPHTASTGSQRRAA